MDWIDRLNESIKYVEENLTGEITVSQLAKIACCSEYHYQRMFTYIAGVSLSEYIRRRRMSLAAVDLQNTDEKIIDVALKYGYSSPTAFSRAFQAIHSVAPSMIKQNSIPVKSFPPLSFKITVKGVEEMNYRIEKKDEFRIVGVHVPLEKEIEKNFETVPKLWQKAAMDGTIPKLVSYMDSKPAGVLGVSACSDEQDWKYYIAVASTQPIAEPFVEYKVGSFTWAIFSGEGVCPQAIQQLERRIVTEWLPTSGYEYDNGPDIELYLQPDPQNAKFEVWIPVKKK